jgi:nitric oxide reductase subunit B
MNQIDARLPVHREDGGIRSTLRPEQRRAIGEDLVAGVLRWVLLVTAIVCFALLALATHRTYRGAPDIPNSFASADGSSLATGADIVAGKSGFPKADLMDYASIFGMGSYFGPDYTAQTLVDLATATEAELALADGTSSFAALTPDQQTAVRAKMQTLLHHVDLTQSIVTLPMPLARAFVAVRDRAAAKLRQDDTEAGYSKARALDQAQARQTADFLIYSALTTVAWRPGSEVSWTQNWPYEPIVGNAPTTKTFTWTSARRART